jgi:hypothetical protein
MTKKEVSSSLAYYRNKGCVVLNFNTSRKMQGHMHGHPDHEILTPNGFLIYIEDKFGKDVMRPAQIKFKEGILKVEKETPRVKYFTIKDGKDLEMVVDYINDALEMR